MAEIRRLPAKTEREKAQFHTIDTAEQISCDLHSLVMCMIVLADTHFEFEAEEKGLAMSYLQWKLVLKSRELRKVFA